MNTAKDDSLHHHHHQHGADHYHAAARSNFRDVLHEATHKTANGLDDDGMTPVMWAAFYGHTDGLRILVHRGGDIDKCDYIGCAALHWAAENGHLECVIFLVSKGANIWALDNEYMSPKDTARIREHEDVYSYLAGVEDDEIQLNPLKVKAVQKKMTSVASMRTRKYQRRQSAAMRGVKKSVITSIKDVDKSMSARHVPTNAATLTGRQKKATRETHPTAYSEHFTSAIEHYNPNRVGKLRKQRLGRHDPSRFKLLDQVEDVAHHIHNMIGFRKSHDILLSTESVYRKNGVGESDQLDIPLDTSAAENDIPSFGSSLDNIYFRKSQILSSLQSLHAHSMYDVAEEYQVGSDKTRSIDVTDSYFEQFDDGIDDDDLVTDPLERFMEANNFIEFMPLLNAELVDVHALCLCNAEDLRSIGIPMVVAERIVSAAQKQLETWRNPGKIRDLFL